MANISYVADNLQQQLDFVDIVILKSFWINPWVRSVPVTPLLQNYVYSTHTVLILQNIRPQRSKTVTLPGGKHGKLEFELSISSPESVIWS